MSIVRMLSGSPTLANDPHLLFSLPPTTTTERGCCAPPVKPIYLISKQNIPPIWKTHNHCPHCTRELPGSPILCCGCWLWRPSPCPAPSTIPPSSVICHSHTHKCNSRTPKLGNSLWTIGRRKPSILWIVTSWTPSTTPWPWKHYTNYEGSANTSTTAIPCLSPSYSSFNPWWLVPVCCLWISTTLSQVGKILSCQIRSIWQKQDPICTMVENYKPLSKQLRDRSNQSAKNADRTLLYEGRKRSWKIHRPYGHNKGYWHYVIYQLWREAEENLPTCCPCSKCRDYTLCIKARQGICWGLFYLTISTGQGGQIQCHLSWMHNCQLHPTSSKVGNCRVHQMKSTRSDWLYKPPSLGNGSGKGRRNSEPDCWKKMKYIYHRAHLQPPLHSKDPDTTTTIPSSCWSSSSYSIVIYSSPKPA